MSYYLHLLKCLVTENQSKKMVVVQTSRETNNELLSLNQEPSVGPTEEDCVQGIEARHTGVAEVKDERGID